MVLILVEGCIAPHVYSESYLGEAAAVALYSIAYIVWNQITYEVNGCWPYTFQKQLDSPSCVARRAATGTAFELS